MASGILQNEDAVCQTVFELICVVFQLMKSVDVTMLKGLASEVLNKRPGE